MWGTFAGTLVNVTEVVVHIVLWVRQSSPRFAKVRMKARAYFWYTLELA